MTCDDCGKDSRLVPFCPAHPTDEYLGTIQGEGPSWRRAGQHSFTVREICTAAEAARDALKIWKEICDQTK